MAFVIGYLVGSAVTVFLFYRMAKKKKADLEKTLSNAQSLNNKTNNDI